MDLTGPEKHLLELLRHAALDVLEDGRATLEVCPPAVPAAGTTFELRPGNPAACRLELGPTVPGETYVYLGPHSTMFEIWLSKEPERFDARIRAIVEAVKRGRYREWVRLENGRLVARGYLGLSSGTFEISHNLFLGWALRARGFEHLTYEPY